MILSATILDRANATKTGVYGPIKGVLTAVRAALKFVPDLCDSPANSCPPSQPSDARPDSGQAARRPSEAQGYSARFRVFQAS